MRSDQKMSNVTYGQDSISILIGQTRIFLNHEEQVSKLGRPFKLSSVRKNSKVPSKWINKVEKYHWIYLFKYFDEKEGFFEIEINYENNFVSLTKI